MDTQFPQFSDLSISFLDSGWDNENYRLGSDYIIRLPRRAAAISLLENEISWLPRIKDSLPINIPAPVLIGKPSPSYPWQWTIIPWYSGSNGCIGLAADNQVIALAEFLKALHQNHPTDAPYNDHRCLPLSSKSEEVIGRIERLMESTELLNNRILELWFQAVAEPPLNTKSLIHGDMHPRNIIIHDGKIEAIIDWGDITAGDVAPDLASIWMLFDRADVRANGFQHYGADDSLITKSMGWAIFFATLFLEQGDIAGGEYQIAGRRILGNILGLTDN